MSFSSFTSLQHPETGELYPLTTPITKSQLVEIFDPVTVVPKVLMLLRDTQSEHYYQHTLKVNIYTYKCMYADTCIK